MAQRCGKRGRQSLLYDMLVCVLSFLLIASIAYLLTSSGKENFEESDQTSSIEGTKRILYVFIMDGCGWCDKFKPELNIIMGKISSDSNLMKKLDVKVIKFPSKSSSDKQLMKDFSVEGFPSIVLSTPDQSKFWMYHSSDERTAEKVLQWAQSV